tara:strand:+ start:80 stop:358 length:279 start_codon:yes stop_codon:yes gene_type:complete
MIFTSTVKHRTRTLEKKINKINKEIVILKKQLSDGETDFVYLSSPAQLKKYLIVLKKEDYYFYDYSRVFYSTDDFLIQNLKETRLINKTLNE